MKPFLFTFLTLAMLIFTSCSDSKKTENKEPEPAEEVAVAAPTQDGIDLKQNGDYSALFNATQENCPLMTPEELEQALSLAAGSVETEGFACSSSITQPDGSKGRLVINTGTLASLEDVKNEISNYLKDNSGLLSAQISESGDTYLCIHKARGSLFIFNPKLERYVNIGYGSRAAAIVNKKKGIETAPETTMREQAIIIANKLLEKYKK